MIVIAIPAFCDTSFPKNLKEIISPKIVASTAQIKNPCLLTIVKYLVISVFVITNGLIVR